MNHASLPDLDKLDRDALLSLARRHQEELASLIVAHDEEIQGLEAELDSHRQTLSQQADELRSRSVRIEHLKLMVEKLRHVIFGTKSEKIVIKLEQMELELEDDETTHAELEAAAERVSPAKETKPRKQPHLLFSTALVPQLSRSVELPPVEDLVRVYAMLPCHHRN
jgi:hypothetical protein